MGDKMRRADGCVCDPTYEDYHPLARCPVHGTAGPAVHEWQGVRWLDLAAPLSLSPEAIDRAARAAQSAFGRGWSWDELEDDSRDDWRRVARAVAAELARDGT